MSAKGYRGLGETLKFSEAPSMNIGSSAISIRWAFLSSWRRRTVDTTGEAVSHRAGPLTPLSPPGMSAGRG